MNMADEVKMILQRCKLEQHYQYLSTKGFNSWDALQLLDQSDFEQLQAIPYGHFKLLLQTVQLYAKEQNISRGDKKIRPKYKQFLKSLNKIPKPQNVFDNVDKQISKYQEIKQQYLTNWTIHQQYHKKISKFIKSTSQSEIEAPIQPQEIRQFITTMQKLNGELQQLLHNMGNTNYDIADSKNNDMQDMKIDMDLNLKPSTAKHNKKKSKKKKHTTPTNWMVDEESSLIQDVKLYSKINVLKIKDMNNEDWKVIALQHNENFWNNTQFKGRSYKDCKSRYKKAPITGIDTNVNEMKGEVDEPSGSDEEDNKIIKGYNNQSSSEDDLGLLSMMQAPPQ